MSVKMIAVALTVFGATMAMASTSVMDVKVQPRSPWNGLVDIDYFIVSDNEDDDVYVNPVGYDGDRGITMFPTSFTGDGADAPVKPGKHRMTWDAKKDFGKLFSCANFQIKLYVGKRLPRYVIVDLSGGSEAENYPVRFSVIGPDISSDVCRTTELWLRLVPPGSFWMGSPEGEYGRDFDGRGLDEDLHKVTITKPFYIGVFEVTQRQWELVMGNRPSYYKDEGMYATRPVENVGYDDIRGALDVYAPNSLDVEPNSFCGKLRMRSKFGGFDLPSEAQWEYAARAGTMSALYSGEELKGFCSSPNLDMLAKYFANSAAGAAVNEYSLNTTAKVGSFIPNTIGLYDLYGNVDEFCVDVYQEHLGREPKTDPVVADGWKQTGATERHVFYRVFKSGSIFSWACDCRSAFRMDFVAGSHTTYYGEWVTQHNKEGSRGFRLCGETQF